MISGARPISPVRRIGGGKLWGGSTKVDGKIGGRQQRLYNCQVVAHTEPTS
jgi:hypothetical protein